MIIIEWGFDCLYQRSLFTNLLLLVDILCCSVLVLMLEVVMHTLGIDEALDLTGLSTLRFFHRYILEMGLNHNIS